METGVTSKTNPCLNNLFLKYSCSLIFSCRISLFTGTNYNSQAICQCVFDFTGYSRYLTLRDILNLAIETIPSNKIFAFGGDNLLLNAHTSIKKPIISGLLYRKVSEGYFSLKMQ